MTKTLALLFAATLAGCSFQSSLGRGAGGGGGGGGGPAAPQWQGGPSAEAATPASAPTVDGDGARIPRAPRGTPCDAAHDHCLVAGSWLGASPDGSQWQVDLYFEHDGKLVPYHKAHYGDDPFLPAAAGTYVRTRPATQADLVVGARVYVVPWDVTDKYPSYIAHWETGVIDTIDPESGEARVGHSSYSNAWLRVAVEERRWND